MALVIRIQPYHEVDPEVDHLGRNWAGHFPRMTEEEAYEAGRGAWPLGDRAKAERVALIVGGGTGRGKVLAAVEIASWTKHEDDRLSLTGTVLGPGHPIRDAYIGQPDPSGRDNRSRFPIAYVRLPEEERRREHRCPCTPDCTETTTRDYASGHDLKA